MSCVCKAWKSCDCLYCEEYKEILKTWDGDCTGDWSVCPCEICDGYRDLERDFIRGIAKDVERTMKELSVRKSLIFGEE